MDSRDLSRKIARLTSGRFSDVTLVVGMGTRERRFMVHRLILSLFSEVFEVVFFGKSKNLDKEIRLPSVDPNLFESVISYMYTGEVILTSCRKTMDLFCLAHKYSVHELKQLCVDYLSENISSNLAVPIYEMTTVMKEQDLRLKCWKYIVFCADEVLASNSFREAKVSTIMSIMDQKFLNIKSEVELYNAIVMWGRQQCLKSGLPDTESSVRRKIQNLLRGIKFLSVEPENFACGPAMGNILTSDEKAIILQNIVAPGVAKLPHYFNPCRNKRNRESPCRLLSKKPPTGFENCSEFRLFNHPCFKEKVKFLFDDVFIYGVRAYLSKSQCQSDLPNAKCDLSITNVSRDCKVETKNLKMHPEEDDFIVEIDDPVYVARGEICEIELIINYTSERVYHCANDCTLPCAVIVETNCDKSDDDVIDCGFHLHGILMWHIWDTSNHDDSIYMSCLKYA